jgi:hypothetical protein
MLLRTNSKLQRRFFATRCIYTQQEEFGVWLGELDTQEDEYTPENTNAIIYEQEDQSALK